MGQDAGLMHTRSRDSGALHLGGEQRIATVTPRALCHGDRTPGCRSSGIREEDTKDAARRDPPCVAASKGDHMTIPFEKLKARLLANPKVKAEYDALAPEFEFLPNCLRLVCGRASRSPSWLPGWGPASPLLPDWRTARRCRAPRRSCATPRRPATSSTFGCRLLDAVFANGRQRYRTKSHSGAPRSMKMGTTRSPWRYDATARHALQSAKPRRRAILRYVSCAAAFPISHGRPVTLR